MPSMFKLEPSKYLLGLCLSLMLVTKRVKSILTQKIFDTLEFQWRKTSRLLCRQENAVDADLTLIAR